MAIHLPRERLRCLAEDIHSLGPRPLFELLVELDADAQLGPALERYAKLHGLAHFIAACDGDRLPKPRRVA